MILRDDDEGYQVRTSIWEEAERAHAEALAVARERVAQASALLPEVWR